MLAVYDPVKRRLDADGSPRSHHWISAVAPTEAERATLRELGVPDELAKDALDTHELSRVDHHHSGAKLFVLRVPASQKPDAEIVTLGIVTLPQGTIVTISTVDTGIPERCSQDGVDAGAQTRFALKLALHIAERFVAALHAIEADVARLEGRLQRALENDEILALLEQQKRLVHFATALEANELVLERALHDGRLDLREVDRVLVEDALVEIRQAGTMTRTAKEMLEATMDALATVVSNNLNVAMKKLASLTLLLSVPTLFAALYGMNVALPLAETRYAFVAVVAVSFAAVAALALVLRARRWL